MSVFDQPRIAAAAQSILDIEHRAFGIRLGLVAGEVPFLTSEQFIELVYAIDEMGWDESDTDSRLAIQLIALTWEHSSREQRYQLRPLCVSVLSRIGVGPSTAMLEDHHQKDGMLQSLSSYASEISASVSQVRFSEIIGDIEYFLTEFQSKVLNSIRSSRVVGISAPTSAGKSFALYLAIVRKARVDSRSIIYIVPTISLMNQVSRDLRSTLEAHGLSDWLVLTSFDGSSEKRIFVLTQERALPPTGGTAVLNFGMIVVDEVQNLERFSDGQDMRSKILLDSITEAFERSSASVVVLSGPRVSNLSELGTSLFGLQAVAVETKQAPVASLTYAISKDSGGLLLNQYSEFCRGGRALRISAAVQVPGLGKARYTDEYVDFISGMIQSLGEGVRPIIFSPTADQARKTAIGMTRTKRSVPGAAATMRSQLADYISESVHAKYDLVRCVREGVGFHSGKVPPHIRFACEMAYSDGVLSTMVCTTTLMQGVNLPANLVVARNPNLFINRSPDRESSRLSPYEFSNLRGRAGRLMKDFVGRTLVLDGDSFEEGGGADLFPDPSKSVAPTYKEVFERDSDAVVHSLLNPSVDAFGSKFICSQVRQAILRHGASAASRLAARGIELKPAIVAEVAKQLSGLDVGREVCLANRYWDPFDLQLIKDNFLSSSLDLMPETPWKFDAARLENLLEFQRRVTPFYFERYLGSSQSIRLKSLSISAMDWARERQLSEILSNVHSQVDQSAAIDDRVSDIQKHVIYGIPALLKPLADISGSGEGLLASIESGVYTSVGRMLVAKGLYRDTAVTVRRRLLPKLDGDLETVARDGFGAVEDGIHRLNYWIQRQVEPLLNQWKRTI
jgi:hypothetical protein